MDSEVKTTYHHEADKLHVKYVYDAEPVIEQNKVERNEFTDYKSSAIAGGLVKVATLHKGDYERIKNLGYDILSSDPDEVKRALLFIQSEQKALMTVTGKPIGKKTQWL